MRSIAEFFRERAAREQQDEQKRNAIRQSWEKINSIVDSTGSAQASFKKIDKTCLPSDLRPWRYYDWLGEGDIEVLLHRRNDLIEIKLNGKLNSFMVLLRGRGNIDPTVLRRQGADMPKPFLPDDLYKFAVNFTRIVRLHWDLAPRLTPQPIR